MIIFYLFIELILWFVGLNFGLVGVIGLLTIFTVEWYFSICFMFVGFTGWWVSYFGYEKINTKRILLELEQLEGHL